MPRQIKRSAGELRKVAADFLARVAEREFLPECQRQDQIASLVRQWLTYDGNAALMLGIERMLYLTLGMTPLGRRHVDPSPGKGWRRLIEDWKIDPADMPEALARLNLAQSAELTNADGLLLRLWVNPAKRSCGVELLSKEARPDKPPPCDYHKMATDALTDYFGSTLAPDEMEALIESVVRQWKGHRGHAGIFLDPNMQLVLTMTEQPDGGHNLLATTRTINLAPFFDRLGFPREAVPQAIGRLNLGERIEFRDRNGDPSVMRCNPVTMSIDVTTTRTDPPPRVN